MRKIVTTYGLLAGAILAATMLATLPFLDRIGFDTGMVIGYASMVAAFGMVFFGVRTYRDGMLGGRIGFGRAMAVGTAITLVASACYVAAWQVVYHRLAPGFLDKYTARALDKARRSGATEAEVAARASEMAEFARLYENPLVNIGFTLLEPLPVGLVFALVSAGVLSRRRGVVPAAGVVPTARPASRPGP